MNRIFAALLCGFSLVALPAALEAPATAQDAPAQPDSKRAEVLDRVRRARNLREFGYPLLAREQLDLGRKVDAASRELLVEYVRLFTRADASREDTTPYVGALLQLYPQDYESCFEVANWLFLTSEPPLPPESADPAKLKAGLERLEAELKVFRELGAFLQAPAGDLPASAQGRPALSLAFLARCAKASPGTAEVSFLAAQELDFRARDFLAWARVDKALAPFGAAAREMLELARPLYASCTRHDVYGTPARVALVNVLRNLGRFEDARAAAMEAELNSPGNKRVADALAAIARDTRDSALLLEAMQKLHGIHNDLQSELDLLVARRIHDKALNFALWDQYVELGGLGGADRAAALRALLNAFPDFLEFYYLDAEAAQLMAAATDNPEDRRRLLDNALAALDRCKELNATFADWHRLRGLVLWMLKRYAEARESYTTTARMDATDADARSFAGASAEIEAGLYTARDYEEYRELQEPGDFSVKLKDLRELTARAPKFFGAQMALGEVATMLTDHETAYHAYVGALAVHPENLPARAGAAQAALWTARWEEAVAHFAKSEADQPGYGDGTRWLALAREIAAGTENRRKAFRLWMESTRTSEPEDRRRTRLEEAWRLDPGLAEVLVDLATLDRRSNPQRANSLLEQALRAPRDGFVRAAAHRELGRLYVAQGVPHRAIPAFEAAYAANKGDGGDLLLAALCRAQEGQHAEAAATMRRLFAELPGTAQLRPRSLTVGALDLRPAAASGARVLGPAYAEGDKLAFTVQLEVEGEGAVETGKPLTLEYEARVAVLATPANGGLWKLALTFGEPPTAEFAALKVLNIELSISPWFGLTAQPAVGALEHVVNPAVQALVEGFTCGLGDAAIQPPYVWKNDLTQGPPHFDRNAEEASYLADALGESLVVQRRAAAGRRLGDKGDSATHSRALAARVKMDGPRRALQEVVFEISKEELTRERDDVIKSRLKVSLLAR
ncbi:MAG: hypothetical protein IT463_08375 [Planctomycetes bacterium]|nr:hypothetical protein [Planctomycetota bacterium]